MEITYTENLIQQAASYGYTIYAIQPNSYSSELEISFSSEFEISFDTEKDRYSASIYKDWNFGEDADKQTYSIQTTSYGALSTEEIGLVIDSLKKAQNMARLMEEVDYSQLTTYLHPELASRKN